MIHEISVVKDVAMDLDLGFIISEFRMLRESLRLTSPIATKSTARSQQFRDSKPVKKFGKYQTSTKQVHTFYLSRTKQRTGLESYCSSTGECYLLSTLLSLA